MTMLANGSIGAPSGTNIYNPSDERLKRDVVNLTGCLDKINQLQGVSFRWIDGYAPDEDGTLYGLVAQDVHPVDSVLVVPFGAPLKARPADIDPDGTVVDAGAEEGDPFIIKAGDLEIETPLRVEDRFIIPMLIEAIKELSAKVEALEAQVSGSS
jgi:hypothetical protein